MYYTILLVGIGILLTLNIVTVVLIARTEHKIREINKNISYQYNLVVKMQNTLKSKTATNSVAQHAEMIYQDLLQHLIPVLASLDIMPRNTSEHPLWRTLGGLLDEYAKNPFVMEKLRRAIKLDPEIKRNVSNYMERADNLLQHLSDAEPDGILTTTFTNGLLGQSLTFFTQAYQLATNPESE